MRNVLRCSLIFIGFLLLLLSQSPAAAAGERFVDNGDGTVTDTRRQLMWQKGDNGEQVTFQEAQKYCRTLKLGGYADWRLPEPDERDTAVAIALMMTKHARDIYSRFDLYWSSDPTTLLPFNYHPSYGKEILRVYPAREGDRWYVRAVRSLRTTQDGGGR